MFDELFSRIRGKNLRRSSAKKPTGYVSSLVFFGIVFSLSFFMVLASITVNIYLHEMGHFVVADSYGLNPEMNISGVISVTDDRLQLNMKPVAYVRYRDPGDVLKNIYITIAGPLMNLLLVVMSLLFYVLMKRRFKIQLSSDRLSKKAKLRVIRLSFIFDIAFISFLVPCLVSVIVNLANISGSDGAFLRELLRQL